MEEPIAVTETVAEAPVADVAPDGGESATPDVFEGQNFDKEFGLEPEDDTVTDPPDSHQVQEAVKAEEEEVEVDDAPETVAEEPAPEPADDTLSEKLNWDSAPKQFRQEFKELKQAFMELANSSVESQFLTSPSEFKKWMEDTSPTSFQEIGTQIATDSANANPKGWLEYFVANQPDLMAEMLTGREGMTADRLKAELEILLDDDEEDVQAAMEKAKANKVEEPKETAEQKEIREWREEREREKQAAIYKEVAGPIETAINSLVSEAGYEIALDAYKGKDFASFDEDTQFRVMLNEFIPQWIESRFESDAKLRNMQARAQEFLAKGDKQSALQLQHPLKIAATNFAAEALSLLTGRRAKAKQSETASPAQDAPKPMVKTAGAVTAGVQPSNGNGHDDMWQVSEQDLFGR